MTENNTLVERYFQLSNELIAHIEDLRVSRGAIIREESQQISCITFCVQCPYFMEGKCGVCGCGMNLRVRVASMHCPLAKW
jgi:hypothetical protein